MSRPRWRRRLFAVHSWLGLNFGLWLFMVCFSGAIATLAPEIEWLTQPALRVTPHGPIRWQATYDAIRTTHPEHQIYGVTQGEETVLENLAWTVYATAPDKRYGVIRVDPYAARVVRPFTSLHLSMYVEQLHYYLYAPAGFLGFYFVTALSFPLLTLLTTGLLFQKAWWRHLFRLRVGARARFSWASTHRFIGAWSLVFGVTIGVTGGWYLVEQAWVPMEIAYPTHPLVPAARLAAHGPTPPALALETYIDAARAAFPELEPNRIDFPAVPGQGVAVSGPAGRFLVRDRANAAILDPFDAQVIDVKRSEDASALSWWVDSADPLHFGYWGGLATKLLWCGLGLSLGVLVLSGAYLALRKSATRGQSSAGTVSRTLSGVPLRSYLTIPIIAVAVWSCVTVYRERWIIHSVPVAELGNTPIGPWIACLSREKDVSPGGVTEYYLRLDAGEGRAANFKRASLRLAGQPSDLAGAAFQGPSHRLIARVPIPRVLKDVTSATLLIEEWSGQEHVVRMADALDRATQGVAATAQAEPVPTATALNEQGAFGVLNIVVLLFVAVAGTVVLTWLRSDRRRPS